MEVKKILCAVDLEDTIAPSVEYAKMMASMTCLLYTSDAADE